SLPVEGRKTAQQNHGARGCLHKRLHSLLSVEREFGRTSKADTLRAPAAYRRRLKLRIWLKLLALLSLRSRGGLILTFCVGFIRGQTRGDTAAGESSARWPRQNAANFVQP